MNKQRVLVVGAGAVGGFYGGKLFQAGCDVSLVCRSDYHVVSKQGFSIASPTGDFSYQPKVFKCVDDVSGDFDVVLVTTKVLPESTVHQEILSVVGPQTMIVLLQNGIDIERPFVEQFPNHLLVSGLAFVCLSRIKPGYILHQHIGQLVFGKFPEGADGRIDEFVSLFQSVDVSCKVSNHIIVQRWKKMVWNAAFNPISVLNGGMTTADMLDDPVYASMVLSVMQDVVALACASGVELSDDVIKDHLARTKKMEPYKTSMLLDYENGRPLELGAILGNALRLADQYRQDVPYLKKLYQQCSKR